MRGVDATSPMPMRISTATPTTDTIAAMVTSNAIGRRFGGATPTGTRRGIAARTEGSARITPPPIRCIAEVRILTRATAATGHMRRTPDTGMGSTLVARMQTTGRATTRSVRDGIAKAILITTDDTGRATSTSRSTVRPFCTAMKTDMADAGDSLRRKEHQDSRTGCIGGVLSHTFRAQDQNKYLVPS